MHRIDPVATTHTSGTAHHFALLLLRIAIAMVFLYHGSAILFGAFGGPGPERFAAFIHAPALVGYLVGLAQFAGGLTVGKASVPLRADDDGWLARIVHFMQECISNASTAQARTCLTKALTTLRSVFSWVMLPAVVSTHALPAICASLSVEDTDVLMVRARPSVYFTVMSTVET